LSVAISQDVFRFLDEGQRLIEVENGKAQNESTSLVLQSAIEECVLDIIKQGIQKDTGNMNNNFNKMILWYCNACVFVCI
jgi:ferredoxin